MWQIHIPHPRDLAHEIHMLLILAGFVTSAHALAATALISSCLQVQVCSCLFSIWSFHLAFFHVIPSVLRCHLSVPASSHITLGHFIFRWNQSLKPWFETKYRFETKLKPKHKVTFQTKFKTKLTAKTKVWNQSFGFKPNLNSAVRFQTKRS